MAAEMLGMSTASSVTRCMVGFVVRVGLAAVLYAATWAFGWWGLGLLVPPYFLAVGYMNGAEERWRRTAYARWRAANADDLAQLERLDVAVKRGDRRN